MMSDHEFKAHVVDKIGTVHERIEDVAATVAPAQLQAAVAAGIREAATDPALWSAVLTAVRTQAKQEAGGWLFSGVKEVLNRVLWLLVLGFGVYLLGGWSALVALFKNPPVGQ